MLLNKINLHVITDAASSQNQAQVQHQIESEYQTEPHEVQQENMINIISYLRLRKTLTRNITKMLILDPAFICSDKTHSIQKSELINHLTHHPNTPIPTRKILKTLLLTPSTNWPAFLSIINSRGLDEDYLIIGLKANTK